MILRKPIRPFASPWRLALRIGVVTGLSCLVGTALVFIVNFYELFGVSCDLICSGSAGALVPAILMWGGINAAVAVPLACIIFTPLIHFGVRFLTPKIGASAAVVSLSIAPLILIVIALLLGQWMSYGVWPMMASERLGLVLLIVFTTLLSLVIFRRFRGTDE